MDCIDDVVAKSPYEQTWYITGPTDRSFEIHTKIVEDREDEHIAWISLPGSDIQTKGRITFRDAVDGRGTYVAAVIAYNPPGGELGRWVAKALAAEPEIKARRVLKRFKMLMETGEIATSASRPE